MERFYVECDCAIHIVKDKEEKTPEMFFDQKYDAENMCQLFNLLNLYQNRDGSFSLIYKRDVEPILVNKTPMDEFIITLKYDKEIMRVEIDTKEKYCLTSYISQHGDDMDNIMSILRENEELDFLFEEYRFFISDKSIAIINIPSHYVQNEVIDSIKEDFPSTKVYFEHMVQKNSDEDKYILKIDY